MSQTGGPACYYPNQNLGITYEQWGGGICDAFYYRIALLMMMLWLFLVGAVSDFFSSSPQFLEVTVHRTTRNEPLSMTECTQYPLVGRLRTSDRLRQNGAERLITTQNPA